MNYKKILILPLALSLSLGSLVACDFGSKDNKPQDTPQGEVDTKPNTDTKPNVEGNTQNGDTNTEQNNNTGGVEQNEGNNEQKPTPSPDTEQGSVVQKKMSLKNIDEFSDTYLKEQVAKDAGVNANQVQIETPEWKTHITTTNDGRKIIEVSLNVKGQDGKVTTYMCVIDLTVISDDLEVVINGPSEIVVGSLEGVTTEKILSKFIITDKKGRNLDATVKLENALDLDLTKAGIYNVLVSAEENTTKVRSLKNITIEVKQQYTVKYQVNGVVVQTDIVEAGKTVVYRGETPTKESTLEFSYEFSGWGQTEGSPIYRDTTFEAKFTETRIAYKVEFLKPDGSLLIEPYYAKVGTNLKDLIVPELPDKRFTGFYLEKELKTPYDTNKVVDNSLTLYGDYISEMEVSVIVKGIGNTQTIKKTVNINTKINDIISLVRREIPNIQYYVLMDKAYDNKLVDDTTMLNVNCSTIELTYKAADYTRTVEVNNYYSINGQREQLGRTNVTFNLNNYKEKLSQHGVNSENYPYKINGKTIDAITIDDLANASSIIVDICPTEFILNVDGVGQLRANEGLTYSEIFRANNKTYKTSLEVPEAINAEYKDITFEGRNWFKTTKMTIRIYKDDCRYDMNFYNDIGTPYQNNNKMANFFRDGRRVRVKVLSCSDGSFKPETFTTIETIEKTIPNLSGRDYISHQLGYEKKATTYRPTGSAFLSSAEEKFTSGPIHRIEFYQTAKKDFAKLKIFYSYSKEVSYFEDGRYRTKDTFKINLTENNFSFTFEELSKLLSSYNSEHRVSGYNGTRKRYLNTTALRKMFNNRPTLSIGDFNSIDVSVDNSNLSYDVKVNINGFVCPSLNNKYGTNVRYDNVIKGKVNYDSTLYTVKYYSDNNYQKPVLFDYTNENTTVYGRIEKVNTEIKVNVVDKINGQTITTETLKKGLNTKLYGVVNTYYTNTHKANYDWYEIVYNGKVLDANSIDAITNLNQNYNVTLRVNYHQTVKYMNEGQVLLTKEILRGDAIPDYIGVTPTKAPTDTQVFEFKGWKRAYSANEKEVIFEAEYLVKEKATVNVEIKKPNGQLLDTKTYRAVVDEKFYDIALKMYNENYKTRYDHYRIISNGTALNNTSANKVTSLGVTYNLTLEVDTLTIYTYKNYDGSTLQQTTSPASLSVSYTGKIPTKPSTELSDFVFNGWNRINTSDGKMITYTAQFREEVNRIRVSLTNLGNNQTQTKVYNKGIVLKTDNLCDAFGINNDALYVNFYNDQAKRQPITNNVTLPNTNVTYYYETKETILVSYEIINRLDGYDLDRGSNYVRKGDTLEKFVNESISEAQGYFTDLNLEFVYVEINGVEYRASELWRTNFFKETDNVTIYCDATSRTTSSGGSGSSGSSGNVGQNQKPSPDISIKPSF